MVQITWSKKIDKPWTWIDISYQIDSNQCVVSNGVNSNQYFRFELKICNWKCLIDSALLNRLESLTNIKLSDSNRYFRRIENRLRFHESPRRSDKLFNKCKLVTLIYMETIKIIILLIDSETQNFVSTKRNRDVHLMAWK